jgi:carbamoylphosphate synthase small subunit
VVCETGARYISINDGSCEGIDYADIRAIAIQFRPPEYTDPGDADAPLNRFISHMGGN